MKGLTEIVKDLRQMNTGMMLALDGIKIGLNNLKASQDATNELLQKILDKGSE